MRVVVGRVLTAVILFLTALALGFTPNLMLGLIIANLGDETAGNQPVYIQFAPIWGLYVLIGVLWAALMLAWRRGWFSRI